jgi:hypothetical protein
MSRWKSEKGANINETGNAAQRGLDGAAGELILLAEMNSAQMLTSVLDALQAVRI